MTVEQTIDKVKVAGSAASGTHSKLARQISLGARRESRNLLVTDMNPFDLALPAIGVGQAIQAVPDDAIHPLDSSGCEHFDELFRN
jgi:hypothetical protein